MTPIFSCNEQLKKLCCHSVCVFLCPFFRPFFLSVSLKFHLVLKSFNVVSRLFKGYLMFKGSFKNVSRKSYGCLQKISRVFPGTLEGVSRKFQGSFWEISRVFQKSVKVVSTKIEGCFK